LLIRLASAPDRQTTDAPDRPPDKEAVPMAS
jgi:hypothetical protein